MSIWRLWHFKNDAAMYLHNYKQNRCKCSSLNWSVHVRCTSGLSSFLCKRRMYDPSRLSDSNTILGEEHKSVTKLLILRLPPFLFYFISLMRCCLMPKTHSVYKPQHNLPRSALPLFFVSLNRSSNVVFEHPVSTRIGAPRKPD